MSVLIKGMKMPKECHECRWFFFQGVSCTEPRYYLDARCDLIPSGQDWYGEDKRGGWVGDSIEHIPGYNGYYPHRHAVEIGTRARQCPLTELPEKHGRLIDRDEFLKKMNLAISMVSGMMKALGAEDDAELQMELKSYRDIREGIKEEPTIVEAEGDEGCGSG